MRFRHPNLILSHVICSRPEVRISPSSQCLLNPDGQASFFTFQGRELESIAEVLEDDGTVDDWELVTCSSEHRIYRLCPHDDVLSISAASATVNAPILDSESSDNGWELRLLFPDREAFDGFREFCKANDVSFRLLQLSVADTVEPEPEYGLTAKQEEALTAAYEEGYFDFPRGITQEELAERVGLSDTAVSQRLRRGTANLIKKTIF